MIKNGKTCPNNAHHPTMTTLLEHQIVPCRCNTQTIGPLIAIGTMFLVVPVYHMHKNIHAKDRRDALIVTATLVISFLELVLSSVSTTICQAFEVIEC